MKLKNDKGYVLTDVSISVIILLILTPVIMGVVYRINSTKRNSEIKSEAINIAVNSLEAAKGIGVSDLIDSNENKAETLILNKLNEENYNNKLNIDQTEGKTATFNTDKGSYMLLLNITDFADAENAPDDVMRNIVKTVNATVKYRTNGTDQEINLSTVIR